MGIYKLDVIRRGIAVVDDVGSLEDAEAYIENCNPVEEVSWSDFLEAQGGGMELQKISIPDSMAIKDFAEKIEVRPAEIIKWLFLRGKIKQLDSEIGFEDMKEFADKYGFICGKGTEGRNIGGHIIKDIVFHIDPIEFYDNMIDFPVMCMEEIPDCFKDEVNQAVNQAISELIENNNILDKSNLILELDIRAQVNVTNNGTECEFVVIVLDSEYKYDLSKRIEVKDNGCLFEFKKYYTKKLEVLFFGDVKTIGGIRQW
jgi:Translation initiation factor IF-2, N-terminal region.